MTALGIVIQPPKGAEKGLEIPPRALGEIPAFMDDDSLINGGSMQGGMLYPDSTEGMRIGAGIFYSRALASGLLLSFSGGHSVETNGNQRNLGNGIPCTFAFILYTIQAKGSIAAASRFLHKALFSFVLRCFTPPRKLV